ncbi:myosin-I heavy chain isoform X1 [Frankliniella occidentalis]|uniref:Myosin-I heavy chain isoform X1 n=1 Tax=Frankliniella occidentalis TaxID=133901 RepID=A0A9C6U4Y4_FRAOC|nr:myosin-I heavy chain isoform X1 [Frankliniella occidentalis]
MTSNGFHAMGCRPDAGVPDMTVISDIDENGINRNLQVRYGRDQIYTYTGSILVAVNPYKEVEIYSPEFVFNYHGQKLGLLEPHVFALAEAAYASLQAADENQSCVISGESGAGKTETTKFILQYLCSVTSNVSTWVEQQILEANTILESFGNAKTVRNDNSSRFGKFMQVCFDNRWMIKGCIIQDYLLEQSRITFQSPQERNYHVFYQLVGGAKNNKELSEQFHLRSADFYKYLNQSGCINIEGVCDAKKFDALRLAFNVVHIPSNMVDGIFSVLSAILWLGNTVFEDVDGERCELAASDKEVVSKVAQLLGLEENDIAQVLLKRQINVRGNITEIPLKLQEADENRHAMAKALYSRTFAWLVNHINTCTNPGKDAQRFLGVLDIFGFENFAVNSFEQLCINYTNEKLHKFFNHYVFALEQEIYRQEEIEFAHITFTDNTSCLELVERPPRCILKLLTEQCHMPKGSDLAYLNNLHAEFDSHPQYVKGEDKRNWEKEFGIVHYAGSVTYNVTGFVDKNRDVQQDVFFDFLSRSKVDFVQELTAFQDLLSCTTARMGNVNGSTQQTMARGTSKGKPTVSDTFRHQLQALVDVLQATNPWYVRCIKPNMHKAPNNYNETLVLDQLKYLGMLDIIRIRKEGFPIHFTSEDFVARYGCLSRNRKKQQNIKDAVRALIKQFEIPAKEWQIGKSKVFLRGCAHEPLEDARKTLTNKCALIIQKVWKGHRVRKEYVKRRNATMKLQHTYRGWKQRLSFLQMRRAVIVIQSHLRGVFAREVAAALREMRRVEEEMRKREKLEEERRQRELERAAREQSEKELQQDLEDSESQYNGLSGMEAGAAQQEIAALSEIAGQLNSKLAASASEQSGESVDLDNLFAFLSDVQTGQNVNRNHIIDQIGEQMDELVEDLDVELESVIQQELEGLTGQPQPPCSLDLPHQMRAPKCSKPTLPEPTEPPPPPPPAFANQGPPPAAPVSPSEPVAPLTQITPLTPPTTFQTTPTTNAKNEPIYESVLPRSDGCVSPPPLPAPPHKLRPKSPGVERLQQQRGSSRGSSPGPINNGHAAPVHAAPPHNVHGLPHQHHSLGPRSDSPHAGTASPRHSRPSSRSSQPTNGQWNGTHEDPERDQRRRFRVERKLQELEETTQVAHVRSALDDPYHDIVEFAQSYFNPHERSPEGTIIATLTRKRKSMEIMPKYEMVTYYRGNTIPTSHIHLYDPENVNVACSIFRDLCRYIRGDLKPEAEISTIQSIIGFGIEREELRDEIFVQCIRQATNNPNPEWVERVWLLLCLAIVAFQPSKLLFKYFVCFLKKNLQLDGKMKQYVQWCLDNCNNSKVSCRQHPPSTVEIAAMRRLGTIVCRFFFLDGRTKAIDIHPTDTASDASAKLADKLGLRSLEGWAIYQSRPDGEEHVRAHHYLYDVIAAWEMKQAKQGQSSSSFPTLSRRGERSTLGSGENRFIFKRRLFRANHLRELSQDPVEINMLYAQAVYHVVKCDDFPVSEKVALQLAGLQAQVMLGDPKDNNRLDYYNDVDSFLPYRVSRSRGEDVWVPIIAHAHRQYGAGRSEIASKVLYLSCVMQYPLYGTTMFPVTYRGYWSYGNSLILGVHCNGLMLIKPDDKFVLYEYRYEDVESLFLDPSDSFITINVMRQHPGQAHHQNQQGQPENTHKCFVFETPQKNEIGSLIVSYCPQLAGWITESEAPAKKVKGITNEDRVRLYHNLVNCRRVLIDGELLRKPQDTGASFLRNTLRRLSKHRLEKLRLEHGGSGDSGETYKGFPYTYWAFSRQPLTQTLSKLPEAEETLGLQVFNTILTYAGLGQDGDSVRRAEDEHINLIKSIMERCMRSEHLLAELYLQLIKQTTEHPDPNSRVNLRHWALLSLACSVILPPQKPLRRYLIAHLKRCASDFVTEEGKFARFAEKCLYKTQGTRRRQWPPSREEIMCTINRRPIYARFHFMDGQYHAVEFHPSATARDVMEIVKTKIGLREKALGYAIYEVLGSSERSLMPDEKVADVMSKWERYRATLAAENTGQTNSGASTGTSTGTIGRRGQQAQQSAPQPLFLFKKHLFLDEYVDLNDPVEKELLYHQVLHGLRCDRYPITEMEAVMLTALQSQLELGDWEESLLDYRSVASHCLAPRLVPVVPAEAVVMHHQSLSGMTPPEAKQAFLNLIQSWPLHRATIFDVMQSFTSNWPRVLWLAVDQTGLHLLEHRSRNALCSYEYESILSYSPAVNCLMIITGSDRKQSKVILTTSQAFQIANLIREYCEVLSGPQDVKRQQLQQQQLQAHQQTMNRRRAAGGQSANSRPVSILHKNTPIIEPQPS